MNNSIFKYPLKIVDTQIVELPKGAEILTVGFQHGTICLWAMMDKTVKVHVPTTIHIIATGIEYDFSNLKYLGTVQLVNGNLIFHVFKSL